MHTTLKFAIAAAATVLSLAAAAAPGSRDFDAGAIDQRQACQSERQQVAALGGGQRVHLVENDIAQAGKQVPGIAMAQQQRDLLRRGEQHIRRAAALALDLATATALAPEG